MTTESQPPNVREFNEITAVIFAKLYVSFPVQMMVDPSEVATVLGVSLSTALPSGRIFGDVFASTLAWLIQEGFVVSRAYTPRDRCVLTTKAMTAMNVIPPHLKQALGVQLSEASKEGSSETGKTKLVELMGNFFGSFTGSATKTMMGG